MPRVLPVLPFQNQFADFIFYLDGIVLRKAGRAVLVGGIGCNAQHALQGEVSQTVHSDLFADEFDGFAVGNKLLLSLEVDSIIARPNYGWAADPDVDLTCTGLTQHPDKVFKRGSPYDGVLYNNNTLALQDTSYGIEFQPHLGGPDVLSRCDECPAHIVIPNQADFVLDS